MDAVNFFEGFMYDNPISLKGHFLIAMPGLQDPNFSSAVVCICEHNPEGSLGLVVNRTFPSLTAKDIFDELRILSDPGAEYIPIHYGGPVHLNEIYILHGPPFNSAASRMVTPSLAISNTRDVLESIAQKRGPTSYIITLGCSGWGPDQMETEMKQNVWLSCPASEEILFEIDIESRWEEAVRGMGINPLLLSDAAGHA